MARKALWSERKIQISIALTPDAHALLNAFSDELGLSRQEVVERLLRSASQELIDSLRFCVPRRGTNAR